MNNVVYYERVDMKKIVICIIVSIFPVLLPAQTATELEIILETEAVTCAQAAKFVLYSSKAANVSLENFARQPHPEYLWALANGWLKFASEDDPISLSNLSFLLMRAFNMKGGLMYRIFPGPRYAYRSMISRNYIQGIADPAMKLDGSRFLLILGRVLNVEGDEQ